MGNSPESQGFTAKLADGTEIRIAEKSYDEELGVAVYTAIDGTEYTDDDSIGGDAAVKALDRDAYETRGLDTANEPEKSKRVQDRHNSAKHAEESHAINQPTEVDRLNAGREEPTTAETRDGATAADSEAALQADADAAAADREAEEAKDGDA